MKKQPKVRNYPVLVAISRQHKGYEEAATLIFGVLDVHHVHTCY